MAIFLTHYLGFPLGSKLDGVVSGLIKKRRKAAERARVEAATTLDGLSSSSFLLAGRVPRISYEGNWESEAVGLRTILAVGPLTLAAQCLHSEEGTVHTRVQLFATGPAGSTLDYSQIVGASAKAGVFSLEPTTPTQIERLDSSDTESANASVTFVYRDSVRTISIPLGIFAASASAISARSRPA